MKQINIPSKKISGRPYLVAHSKTLFRHGKYSVTLSSSRIRLTKLTKRTNLTGGRVSSFMSQWRTGPKGHKYVFISVRDMNIVI